ncbi:hypothetical protein CGRA01v4_08213 [Colletotrichum graminicola]|nr:hypothetical protein CGRA01v4_08213 [Colletotrichum graminicola]
MNSALSTSSLVPWNVVESRLAVCGYAPRGLSYTFSLALPRMQSQGWHSSFIQAAQ